MTSAQIIYAAIEAASDYSNKARRILSSGVGNASAGQLESAIREALLPAWVASDRDAVRSIEAGLDALKRI